MAAIPNVPASPAASPDDRGDWQSMRLQLFGERRRREAEDRLLAALTALHTQLAAATRQAGEGPGAASLGPIARAAVLRSLNEGINRLLRWRAEQLQAAGTDGRHAGSTALATALALVQHRSPLFEAAIFEGDRLDCEDVIQSIGALCGAESDGFFAEALAGLVALLEALVEELQRHPATAGAVAGLGAAFAELFGELQRLVPPEPAPAPEGAPAGIADDPAGDDTARGEESRAASLAQASGHTSHSAVQESQWHGVGQLRHDLEAGPAGPSSIVDEAAETAPPLLRLVLAPDGRLGIPLVDEAAETAPPPPVLEPASRHAGTPVYLELLRFAEGEAPAPSEPASSPRTLAARLFVARLTRMEEEVAK